jgi:hypothetical protein
MEKQTKGFLFVASLSKAYYDAAIGCIRSLRDHYPDAKIALFTHKMWMEDRHAKLVDDLVLGIPVHVRAKLWCLPRSPYDITAYIDVDGYFVSDDVQEIFDQLPVDKDLVMTYNRAYNAKVVYHVAEDTEYPGSPARELRHWKDKDMAIVKAGKAHTFRWHCGFFVWRKNQHTEELWTKWLETYKLHNDTHDGHKPYCRSLSFWDTFAFWRVLHENPHLRNIVGAFDSQRWNFVNGYREEEEIEEGKEMVFYHYSIGDPARREGQIREDNISSENGTWRVFK